MQQQIELKFLSTIDAKAIEWLESDCFDQHSRWTKQMIEDSIKATTSKFFGAYADGKMVGYCVIADMVQEFELLRTCVARSCQRLGIGYKLLSFVINHLQNQITSSQPLTQDQDYSMFLEVNADNISAQKLYEKSGFNKICVRKNYYFEAGQYIDAIIMRLTI